MSLTSQGGIDVRIGRGKLAVGGLVTAAVATALAAGGAAGETVAAAPGTQAGPSSSQSAYVERAQPGVVTKPVLTVGDSVNLRPDGTPYRMVGIPDGLGTFDNGDGTFTVLMNHELPSTAGVVRAHGAHSYRNGRSASPIWPFCTART